MHYLEGNPWIRIGHAAVCGVAFTLAGFLYPDLYFSVFSCLALVAITLLLTAAIQLVFRCVMNAGTEPPFKKISHGTRYLGGEPLKLQMGRLRLRDLKRNVGEYREFHCRREMVMWWRTSASD